MFIYVYNLNRQIFNVFPYFPLNPQPPFFEKCYSLDPRLNKRFRTLL